MMTNTSFSYPHSQDIDLPANLKKKIFNKNNNKKNIFCVSFINPGKYLVKYTRLNARFVFEHLYMHFTKGYKWTPHPCPNR